MRVDGAAPRGLWPPVGGGLCRRVVKGKVLRIDRPDGRRVLKFDGAFGPEGCGLPLCGNAYKISVTDLLSVPYGMISILRIGSLRSPPPIRLRRTSPASEGRIKL